MILAEAKGRLGELRNISLPTKYFNIYRFFFEGIHFFENTLLLIPKHCLSLHKNMCLVHQYILKTWNLGNLTLFLQPTLAVTFLVHYSCCFYVLFCLFSFHFCVYRKYIYITHYNFPNINLSSLLPNCKLSLGTRRPDRTLLSYL